MIYKCTKCDKLIRRDRIVHSPVCFDCKLKRQRIAALKSRIKAKEKKDHDFISRN